MRAAAILSHARQTNAHLVTRVPLVRSRKLLLSLVQQRNVPAVTRRIPVRMLLQQAVARAVTAHA